jgi:hypothetical protein
VRFTAHSPLGPVPLTLGERELANLTVGGDPQVFGLLPAAVDAALDHDLAPLERLVAVSRLDGVRQYVIDPTLFSVVAGEATSCHDYPRPYDLAAAPRVRRAQYERELTRLDPAQFRPFSAPAWLGTEIDAGPKCLYWPADPTAASPLRGHSLPDVPVLVQSSDLDTVTPVEQGRRAAAQFAHPVYAVVASAGHTPDQQPCGLAMAIEFVEHLKTDPNRCLRAGRPPAVVARPPLHAAQLHLPSLQASVPVRRAVAIALATLADERGLAAYSGMTGTVDALRGGTYVVAPKRVRFVAARVVDDATVDGILELGRRSTEARLRLRGSAVPPSRLALRTTGRTTHISGTVGRQRVDVRVPS